MPGYDKTGPAGAGPGSGRGLGVCRDFVSRKRGSLMITLAVPVVAAVIGDARNPDGITRRLAKKAGEVLFRNVKALTEKRLLRG